MNVLHLGPSNSDRLVETNLIMIFSRSTKLVIIERLLLLAERYVITIEVQPVSSLKYVTNV